MFKLCLPKQVDNCSVSHKHIGGSGLELIKFTFFFKLVSEQVLVFIWIIGSSQVNVLLSGGLLLCLAKSINKEICLLILNRIVRPMLNQSSSTVLITW